jgi:prepilin-type N-terminal cleavage/methylation domain-containing protein
MKKTTSVRVGNRGFTLVELMVVVVIVGILSTIGVSVFRKQSFGSKSAEAMAMIQSIRAAEERWKAENLRYLNVSPNNSAYYPVKPTGAAGAQKRNFYQAGSCAPNPTPTEDCLWKLLGPSVPGPVQFGYNVMAGGPGPMAQPELAMPKLPDNPDHWYVIQACADADGDGRYARFAATSLNGEVGSENEGE